MLRWAVLGWVTSEMAMLGQSTGMAQARVPYTKIADIRMGHTMMVHSRVIHSGMGHSCRVCIRRLGLAGAKKIVYIEHAVDACRVAVYKRCSGLHNTA